ncbi:MAG: non-lysosomal glucosylceramidase [Anaerolineae bacterium]
MSPSASRPRKVYRGEHLRAVAMPLGGIGTGTIALAGDGSLRQWQIHNQINHLACVPHSFFAVWTRRARPPEEPVARVLQSSALYDVPGPPPPPTSNDHIVPLAHRRLLQDLPGVAETAFIGEYPIAEVQYLDPELPITVSMEAFSPFVPLNSRESGIPVIIFNVTAHNPTNHVQLVSIAATLQNAVGWDGVIPIFDNECSLYGGNVNALARVGDLTAIQMTSTRLPEDDDGYGSMALGTLAPEATYLTQWEDLDAFWADFASDGRLSNVADSSPSPMGETWNGALAVPFPLGPGESRTITFLIAWHFPNRYVNYSQRWLGIEDEKSKFWIGNYYATWLRSALDAASYVAQNYGRLAEITRRARDTFFDTTLPEPLIDAVTSQMSIIRSPTCFWAEDGRFFGFEGCNGASTGHNEPFGGCCPLNCTHVWNYEMALARLFPDLERTMRETEWDVQQHPSGYLPHRVVLPLYLPRLWDRHIGGPANPALDGLLGGILKTYREYRACGDIHWLRRVWPSVKRALRHIWEAHDPDQTGVIEGEQPNTYDISIYGANTFIGSLYLAALHAVEAMAGLLGEDELASQCREVFERGRAALDERLWNGEYYIQDVDLEKYPEQNWGVGCHSDQLLGQWWAHLLGLGYVLDPDHVGTAARSIFRYNFREHFRGFEQRPRAFVTEDDQGLLMCTWPHGGRPAVPTLYSDEVWTGIEYEVAALLLFERHVDEAIRLLSAVRTRYDGRKQNPWNDIECGDHYVRAMASWSLLEAAMGYRYDAGRSSLAFAPVTNPERFKAPFVARDGWGSFSQRRDERSLKATIALAEGELEIQRLSLKPGHVVQSATAQMNGQPIAVEWAMVEEEAVLTFQPSLALKASDVLTVSLVVTA